MSLLAVSVIAAALCVSPTPKRSSARPPAPAVLAWR